MTKVTTTHQALLDALRVEFEKEQRAKRDRLLAKSGLKTWMNGTIPHELNFTRKDGEYIDMYLQAEWQQYANMVKTITKAVLLVSARQEEVVQ